MDRKPIEWQCAIDADPKNPLLYLGYARDLLNSQRKQEAIKILNQGLQLNYATKFEHHFHFQLSQAYGSLGNREVALDCLEMAALVNPEKHGASFINALISSGNPERALLISDKLSPESSESVSTRYHILGKINIKKGEFNAAVKAMKIAYRTSPNDISYAEMIYTLHLAGEFEAADKIDYLRNNRFSLSTHSYVPEDRPKPHAEVSLLTGLSELQATIEADYSDPKPYLEMGLLFSNHRRFREALIPLKAGLPKSLQHFSEVQFHHHLAIAYTELNDRSNATKHFEISESLEPGRSRTYIAELLDTDRLNQAIWVAETFKGTHPGDNSILPAIKGTIAMKRGHMREAIGYYEEVFKLHPSEANRDMLVEAYISINEPQRALEAAKKFTIKANGGSKNEDQGLESKLLGITIN